MLGFAVVDHRGINAVAAVWLTSKVTRTRADHTNAVEIELQAGADALKTLHTLTRDRLVVMTEGSTSKGLPINSNMLTLEDVHSIVSETVTHQARIIEAVEAHSKKTRNGNLVRPAFDKAVSAEPFVGADTTATQRAFQTANYVAQVWTNWLATDAERQIRTENPRTKETPWIMPEGMSNTAIEDFPAALTERFFPQPVEPFNA